MVVSAADAVAAVVAEIGVLQQTSPSSEILFPSIERMRRKTKRDGAAATWPRENLCRKRTAGENPSIENKDETAF